MNNRAFVLAERPWGMPDESTFRMVESPIAELKEGELLLRALYLSVDPYMRGRLNQNRSYAAPVEIGQLMVGGGVARVVESKHADYVAGDVVVAYT
jgi:NADPH-dependent curcumin reductase CurA